MTPEQEEAVRSLWKGKLVTWPGQWGWEWGWEFGVPVRYEIKEGIRDMKLTMQMLQREAA